MSCRRGKRLFALIVLIALIALYSLIALITLYSLIVLITLSLDVSENDMRANSRTPKRRSKLRP
jgi:cytochrome c-type biogenesis protein CcmE